MSSDITATRSWRPRVRTGSLETVPLINSEDSALRLARAICADIRTYNEKKLRTGEDLSDEIAEGRGLYRERVESTFYPLFEGVVAELLPDQPQGVNSTAAVTTDIAGSSSRRLGHPEGLFRGETRGPDRPSWGIRGAMLGALLVVVAIALAWLAKR